MPVFHSVVNTSTPQFIHAVMPPRPAPPRPAPLISLVLRSTKSRHIRGESGQDLSSREPAVITNASKTGFRNLVIILGLIHLNIGDWNCNHSDMYDVVVRDLSSPHPSQTYSSLDSRRLDLVNTGWKAI
jgi:hypothetical protein